MVHGARKQGEHASTGLHHKLFLAGALPVAAVALAGFHFGLGVFATIAGEAAADVVAFLELALAVAADEAFVAAGVDQLALGR